jgi:hypothetical protein
MKRPLQTIGVAGLLGLLAGCLTASASRSSGDTDPIPSNSSLEALAPEPSSTAATPRALPTAAPPLSERANGVLEVDRMDRFNDAIEGKYPGPPHEIVDDTFIVISGDPSASLDKAVKVTRETVDALWNAGLFLHRPEQSVVVWVASSSRTLHALESKHAPGMRESALGMYEPRSRQIFVAPAPAGWGSYQHDLIHPLIRADFPLAPAWLVEGLPALFEVTELRPDGTFGFGAHFRLETLRKVMTKPPWAKLLRLDKLFTWTTDDAFRNNEQLDYAIAREALRWLHSLGLLWPFYTAWREGVLEDPTGEKAFEKVVHKTPAEASQAWQTWLCSTDAEAVVPPAGMRQ